MAIAIRIEEIRHEVTLLAEAAPTTNVLMQGVCKLLHDRMLKYNWVGFYMLEPGARPVAGELDIDSHFPAAFGAEDKELVQFCAEVVGKKLEQSK